MRSRKTTLKPAALNKNNTLKIDFQSVKIAAVYWQQQRPLRETCKTASLMAKKGDTQAAVLTPQQKYTHSDTHANVSLDV